MNWVKLNGKKSPSFDEDVLILNDAKEWDKGYLREKSETPEGIKYSFHNYGTGETVTNVVAYMKIENPTDKAGL